MDRIEELRAQAERALALSGKTGGKAQKTMLLVIAKTCIDALLRLTGRVATNSNRKGPPPGS
jgi:hypothetical protein